MADEERAVVITGASSGIGEACALYLDQKGFRVFAGVRKPGDGEALRQKASERLTPVAIEVTQPASIEAALATVGAALGDRPLAGLVNNAGISGHAPLELQPLETVRRMFEVNLFGAIAMSQAFLPLLRRGAGRLVFIGAAAGRVALPFFAAYSASKYAVEAVADSLRVELAPWNIAVSMVDPGSVATPIFGKDLKAGAPLESRFSPDELALYGEAIAAVEAAVAGTSKRGIPAEKVALAVESALTARRPRTRYPVGSDARMIEAVARKLPDRMRDAILQRTMGLPGRRPS